jgi:hypothetical protein
MRRRKADTGHYELARFSLIVGYLAYFKGGGSILDVGK